MENFVYSNLFSGDFEQNINWGIFSGNVGNAFGLREISSSHIDRPISTRKFFIFFNTSFFYFIFSLENSERLYKVIAAKHDLSKVRVIFVRLTISKARSYVTRLTRG